jgi:hypothetical protein
MKKTGEIRQPSMFIPATIRTLLFVDEPGSFNFLYALSLFLELTVSIYYCLAYNWEIGKSLTSLSL